MIILCWLFFVCLKASAVLDLLPLDNEIGFGYFRRHDQPLEKNIEVKLLVVVTHGINRNGKDYFDWIQESVSNHFGQDKNKSKTVYALATWFPNQNDKGREVNQVFWDGDEWKTGHLSTTKFFSRYSSFSCLDRLLTYIVKNNLFPNLQAIKITGHSAGGQYSARYAMSNIFEPKLNVANRKKISISYLPANPSTYPYLDHLRPILTKNFNCTNYCINTTIMETNYQFKVPNATSCPDYDDYIYGLKGKLNEYLRQSKISELINNFLQRQIHYMAGGDDVCNGDLGCGCEDSQLDRSCQAGLQGHCRLERAFAHFQSVQIIGRNKAIQVPHSFTLIPHVGHHARQLFNTKECQIILYN